MVALWAACSPAFPPVRTMELEWIRPRDLDGVYLNEDLVLAFSTAVDPATVTGQSLRIQDSRGEPARGEWYVEGQTLRFSPRPVLARDLRDGGYRPGTTYTLFVAGFPRVGALRGVEGEVLSASLSQDFLTASPSDSDQVVFDDASPARALPLRLDRERRRIGPESPLLFRCDEPLDPSSLVDDEYVLYWQGRGEPTRVPLHLKLKRNRDPEDVRPGEACALLEMWPLERPFRLGDYYLVLPSGPSLRDFGGNPVSVQGRNALLNDIRDIRVIEGLVDDPASRIHLTFLDDSGATPLAVPGVDGTAFWSDHGRVEVGFPAAAGDGRDGAVVLAGREERKDVHATHLTLPVGQEAFFEAGPGLRILRAQGRLTLSGSLLREGTPHPGPDPPRMPLRASDHEGEPPDPVAFSRWLRNQIDANPSWTILIAGGDLVIDGELRVDTPLLLVAGGMIRAIGDRNVSAVEHETWLLGRGRGWGVEADASVAETIFLDSPLDNPLRVPLRYAVVSDPVPSSGQLLRWLSVEADGWPRRGRDSEAGSWIVRYLPSRAVLDRESTLEHPDLMDQAEAVRVWIELEVRPGPRWDPPFLDYVLLRWEEIP